jgi:hypothetical protein
MLLVMYFSPFSGTSCLLCGIIISIMCIQTIVPHNIAVHTRQLDIRTLIESASVTFHGSKTTLQRCGFHFGAEVRFERRKFLELPTTCHR